MMIRFSPDAAHDDFTPVNNRFLLDYMPHADGIQVSVYLYGLMQCRFPSASEQSLADALGLSENAVAEAFSYWQEQGLVRIRSEKPLIVEYLSFDEASASDAASVGQYGKLVSALNILTAPRQFDLRELRHVYDWVEVFRIEEDAVLELVSYCMDTKGRRVSVNYIDTVAASWAEHGIRTRSDAIAHIEKLDLKKHGATEILRAWNKRRLPTKDEMALYEKWVTEWGFTEEAILKVLPRLTDMATPTFAYLDERLEGLRSPDGTTAEDILNDDAKTLSDRAFARLLFERAGKVEPPTKTHIRQIGMYLDEYKMPRELLLFGAEQCRGANEPFGLMKKLFGDWHEKGIDTIEKAEAALGARPARSRAKAQTKPDHGYDEHTFSREELDALLVDLDKEI